MCRYLRVFLGVGCLWVWFGCLGWFVFEVFVNIGFILLFVVLFESEEMFWKGLF